MRDVGDFPRQAFAGDGRDPLGLYFGATSGEVFGSIDAGRSWFTAAAPVPVTGNLTPTLVMFIMGLVVMAFGYSVWKMAESQ